MKAPIDDGYRLLAARYFRKQARQLADQLSGVREAEDIEYVHRARVASRRLRAAMKLLGDWVPGKQAKRWQKEIRRVTGELGDARDKDVQIEFLCKAISQVEEPACCPGIADLLMHLEYRREVLQPKVVEAADRLEASGVVGRMREAADEVLSELGKREGGVRSPGIIAHVTKHILRRLKQLLSYQDSLEDSEDQERHHQMRIAAKRLRYTLEISKPVYRGQLREIITAVKKVQTLLGEIHDCDVWDTHLEAFLEEERRRLAACFGSPRPFTRVKIGLEYLQRNRCEARERLFQELIEYWQTLRGQGLWEKLAGTVRGDAPPDVEEEEPPGPPAPVVAERAEHRENGNGQEPGRDSEQTRHLHPSHATETTVSHGSASRAVGRSTVGK